MIRFQESKEVLGWHITLNVMRSADDESAPWLADVHALTHMLSDLLGGAEWKNTLDIYSAVKGDVLSILLLEARKVHLRGPGLKGLKDVQASINEFGDQRSDTPASVMHCFDTVAMSQLDIGPESSLKVPLPRLDADHGAGLHPKIIAHHEDVNRTLRRPEDALIVFEMVGDNVVDDAVDNGRL